ncbi:acyl-CoA mutase large subunit family protein [Bacillus timonensis]|nr:acyl-CoA mutase large subunit family protein [Bacillus timonensis]
MNNVEQFKSQSFPSVDYDTWKNEAEKSLKGRPFDKLFTNTYEGIQLKPLYTKQDLEKSHATNSLPGEEPFRRGTSALGYKQKPWYISQELTGESCEELNQLLREELARGLSMIHIVLNEGVQIHSIKEINLLFKGISLIEVPLLIDTQSTSLPFLSLFQQYCEQEEIDTKKLVGTVGMDPLGYLAKTGNLPLELTKLLDHMVDSIKWSERAAPHLRVILVNGQPYHNGGASSVQELAFAMATATDYIRACIERGLQIDAIAPKMTFSFSIGSNMFMEIAKLRAAKEMWSTIIKAFGGNRDSQKMNIHARTSAFTKTVFDPYVNMLRSTTEAFAAAIGGVDSLHVSAFDEPFRQPDSFSRRIARNTQLILQEEAHLKHIVDPAGGSWYVETLTDQVGQKAWTLFQEVESEGGMFKALQKGFIQEKINFVYENRMTNVKNRTDKIVGTNMYANLQETLVHQDKNITFSVKKDEHLLVEPVPTRRISEPFEALRMNAISYKEKNGFFPKIGLINIGSITDFKPRADFITGFFEVGGFQLEKIEGNTSKEELVMKVANMDIDTFVFCGKDEDYQEYVEPMISKLNARKQYRFYIAGKQLAQSEKDFKELGVLDFIHMKSNCYELLASLQADMGVF